MTIDLPTYKARVTSIRQVSTRYGPRLVLNANISSDNREVAIWSEDLNNPLFKKRRKGDLVCLLQDEKENFTILDLEPEDLEYSNDDLGLPQPLNPNQWQNLEKLTKDRAKLLINCIDIVGEELKEQNFEPDYSQQWAKSLGVTLFIQMTRYLP